MVPADLPPVAAVVETAVYAADLAAAEAFYVGVFGLPVAGREPGRHVFFRVGDADMLLVFDPATTRAGGGLPPHGAAGPGHFALGVRADDLDGWKAHLAASGWRSSGSWSGPGAAGPSTSGTRPGTRSSWSPAASGAPRPAGSRAARFVRSRPSAAQLPAHGTACRRPVRHRKWPRLAGRGRPLRIVG